MSEDTQSSFIILPEVRLSYNDLWVRGKPVPPNTEGKFQATVLFPRDSEAFKRASAHFLEVAKGAFGPGWEAIMKNFQKNEKCLRRGDENLDKKTGAVVKGYEGMMYVKASSEQPPMVIGAKARKPDGSWNILTPESGIIYSGCYVNLKINMYAVKARERVPNGVHAALQAVQFVRDGEAFGAGPGTADGFEDVPGASSGDVFGDAGGGKPDDLF